MSAVERVWIAGSPGRSGYRRWHDSPACATHSGDPDDATPSFGEFCTHLDPCGVCVTAHDWDGDAVRALRERHQLTQAELAEELPISPSTITNWESQGTRPDAETAAILDQIDARPPEIDWDALEPAIRRVFECEGCGETFYRAADLSRHRGSSGTCGGPPMAACETCIETTDQLALAVHRLEEHGVPQGSRLGALDPGEFERVAERAESLPDLAERLGFTIQRTVRLCRIYDISVGPTSEPPDGDDSWTSHYDRAQSARNGDHA